MTGTGYYLDFAISSTTSPIDGVNTEISEAYPTLLADPCDLVGFTLFIRNGVLSWLEGYTFGGAEWPEAPMEKWLLFQDHRAPQKVK